MPPLEQLKTTYRGFDLWFAGLPGLQNLFVRDGIESGILSNDPVMLKTFIAYGAHHQGTKYNSTTGEEPGKIPHERNPKTHTGIETRPGFNTEYNACDTTAHWLIGLEHYVRITGDYPQIEKLQNNTKRAVSYIETHINREGFFFEDPSLSGAEEFALNVTYWKDSVIPGRRNGKPVYPIVYTLAHVQNIAGLRAAAKLLPETSNSNATISRMTRALDNLWDTELGAFVIAKDSLGPIQGISSDSLHILYYLDPGDITPEKIGRLIDSSKPLETSAGYRTLSPKLARMRDGYHARTIWPYEQAKINAGARKHRAWAQSAGLTTLAGKLQGVEEVSQRVLNWLKDNDHEIFVLGRGKKITSGGNNPQLWTIAAKHYFATSHS